MAENMAEKKLQITLIKSPIGNQIRAKKTVKALGFTKLNQTVIHPDNPSVRGMLYLVKHLVTVAEVTE